MGISTDAILAFGVPVGDEGDELPWDDTYWDDWDDWFAQTMNPSLTEDSSYKERRDAEADCPVELLTYGADAFISYFIAVKGMNQTTRRGYCEPIDLSPSGHLESAAEWAAQWLPDIEWDPEWCLMSWWG